MSAKLCHKGKEMESCMMYRIGKCCDPEYQFKVSEAEEARIRKEFKA
jgi:hypothetical protein